MNILKKLKIIFVLLLSITLLNGCVENNISNPSVLSPESSTQIEIAGEIFIDNNYKLFKNSKIYLLKNQSEGQILSVVVENKKGELIIFDGGRIADAEFLTNFINEKGGVVDYWFITHIHDDHLGALYDICNEFYEDIKIKNICYNFPAFNWFYERVGNDAGSMLLFEDAVEKYKKYHEEKSNFKVNINYNINKNDIFNIDNIKIKVMNNKYLIDKDCINNSSIAFKVYIEDKTMMVLGDLAYEAGVEFEKEYENSSELKSDIVVMSHHGQAGVDKSVYEKISPKFALWPTTDRIYNSASDKYKTNEVRKWMEDMSTVNITTEEYNQILQ